MSIKIKMSYESPQELQEVLKRLEPMTLSCKVPKGQEGRYKRAYINAQTDKKPIEKCHKSVT